MTIVSIISPCTQKQMTYTNITGSKQELSVQVTLFNCVHIGDSQMALGTCTQTHHSPILEHFTTNGTSTHKEFIVISNLLLESLTEYSNLTIITRTNLNQTESSQYIFLFSTKYLTG